MSARIEIGSKWGRWTVMRQTSPAQRYGEAGRTRARAVVKCVCGEEQVRFVSDLRSGKSAGCKSSLCVMRWRAAEEIRQRLAEVETGLLAGAPIDKPMRKAARAARKAADINGSLSVQEAAHSLGCHANTVRRCIARGELRVVRLGREIRIPHAEFMRRFRPAAITRTHQDSPPTPMRTRRKTASSG